jgi:hypothetical protein
MSKKLHYQKRNPLSISILSAEKVSANLEKKENKFGANPISALGLTVQYFAAKRVGLLCGSRFKLGVIRVRLSLGDTVYVSDEKDHGIIEQFVPYGKIIVRLVKKGKVLKLSRGDVKKSRHSE